VRGGAWPGFIAHRARAVERNRRALRSGPGARAGVGLPLRHRHHSPEQARVGHLDRHLAGRLFPPHPASAAAHQNHREFVSLATPSSLVNRRPSRRRVNPRPIDGSPVVRRHPLRPGFRPTTSDPREHEWHGDTGRDRRPWPPAGPTELEAMITPSTAVSREHQRDRDLPEARNQLPIGPRRLFGLVKDGEFLQHDGRVKASRPCALICRPEGLPRARNLKKNIAGATLRLRYRASLNSLMGFLPGHVRAQPRGPAHTTLPPRRRPGRRGSSRTNELITPPTIGAAMRFITSARCHGSTRGMAAGRTESKGTVMFLGRMRCAGALDDRFRRSRRSRIAPRATRSARRDEVEQHQLPGLRVEPGERSSHPHRDAEVVVQQPSSRTPHQRERHCQQHDRGLETAQVEPQQQRTNSSVSGTTNARRRAALGCSAAGPRQPVAGRQRTSLDRAARRARTRRAAGWRRPTQPETGRPRSAASGAPLRTEASRAPRAAPARRPACSQHARQRLGIAQLTG
jgi:hypothetical protein